jgi:hypothetical protein
MLDQRSCGGTALSAPARIVIISDDCVAKIDVSESKEVAEIAMLRPLRAPLPPFLRQCNSCYPVEYIFNNGED